MSGFNKPIVNRTNAYKQRGDEISSTRNIYYGEVLSITDPTDGGRIKVRIKDLDNKTLNADEIPWSYPLMPKYFHIIPQVGEMVRIFIEDIKYPERNRFWLGGIISQPHKIKFDSKFTALSTTNQGLVSPEKAPSTYPDAKGVFPLINDVALIGRVNTDVILRTNEVHIRAGKHENDNILKLNTKNPAQVSLIFEQQNDSGDYSSNSTIMADKIAIISHSGKPKFKSANLTKDDRERIFNEGHPMVRGDVLVEIIKIFRDAIISHIHGYSNLSAEKTEIIKSLENIDFSGLIQKNIVIN
jgi:hypothetical protein